jgi:hypothetical protein
MNNKFITFLEIHEEIVSIISGPIFGLLTLIFIALITSSWLQNKLAINPETYTRLMLLFFVILNIYCILFILFLIYVYNCFDITILGTTVFWLHTTNLILTCLIVYDLFLFLIIKSILLYMPDSIHQFTTIETTILIKLVPIVKVLIQVLIFIKLIVGLSAIIWYLCNYVKNDDTFDFNSFFILTTALIIIIAMNKLFRVVYKDESGALSENKFVYGLLCLLLLLIVYLIVLDIVNKNNKKQLSSSYYIVAIVLLIVFISSLFIFFILSFLSPQRPRPPTPPTPKNSEDIEEWIQKNAEENPHFRTESGSLVSDLTDRSSDFTNRTSLDDSF